MMIIDPDQPFTLRNLQTMLRQNVDLIPRVLMDWQASEGLCKDVPLLPPDSLAPKAFTELKGTVRVTSTDAANNMLTLAGLLETPAGVLILTTMVISPADMNTNPDPESINRALAQYGETQEDVAVEIAAVLGAFDESGKPAGIAVSRPLIAADPVGIVRAAQERGEITPGQTPLSSLVHAAQLAIADDHPIVGDHGQPSWTPLTDPKVADIWGTLFAIARRATVGLAAQKLDEQGA